MSCGALFEDHARLDITDIRKAVGGRRKLRNVDRVTLHLDDGDVDVALVRMPANLGVNGEITYLTCPSCGKRVSVLRLLAGGRDVGCSTCLRRSGVRYASQVAQP